VQVCNNISEGELCPVCRDPGRDAAVLCVVEEPHNIIPIETTRQFAGVYHVLHGAISPLKGIGPEQLRIKSLIERLEAGVVRENDRRDQSDGGGRGHGGLPLEADQPLGITVTRIAMGIPVGSDLDVRRRRSRSRNPSRTGGKCKYWRGLGSVRGRDRVTLICKLGGDRK